MLLTTIVAIAGPIVGWQAHRFYLRRLYGAGKRIRRALRGGAKR